MEQPMENEVPQEEALDLMLVIQDMLRGLRKFWWLIVVLAVAFGAVGAWRSISSYVPWYRCEASFTVNTQESSDDDYVYSFYYDKSTAQQMAKTFPHILASDLLKNLLKEDLGSRYTNGSISANAVADSNLFTLSVVSRNPEDALAILESVIRNYPTVSAYVLGETVLTMIDPPKLPEQPYNSREWINSMVKYGLIGLILGVGVLVLYALTRNTIRLETEIVHKLSKPCLGVIPKVVFKRRSRKGNTAISLRNDRVGYSFRESIRGCALHISNLLTENNYRVLGLIGSVPGEGTSTLTHNLALAMAENGKRVVVLNGAFTQPVRTAQGSAFGLEDYLAGGCSLEDILVYKESEKIWTISCSRRLTQQEVNLGGGALQELVRQAGELMDLVLVDVPACDKMNQAVPAVELCDALVYVIRQDNVKKSAIMNHIEDLYQYDAKLLGCILNEANTGISGYSYGSYGYGRYGYGRYGYSQYGYGGYGYGGYGYGEKKKS